MMLALKVPRRLGLSSPEIPGIWCVDAEEPPDLLFRAAGHGALHDEFVLSEEFRGLRQPQYGVVGRAYVAQLPSSGLHRFDVVFGRQIFEIAGEVERVGVVRIERQQSRRSEKQRFDGMRRQPFAQNGFVGYAPRQREVGFLILTVAQRAEVEQVEGLVPVLRRFVPQRLHHAHFAFEPVEEQRRAYLAALQG